MLTSSTNRPRRAALGGVVAVVTLALGGMPVLADTEKGHSGPNVGEHSLRDSFDKPGVKCHYRNSNGRLKAFEVRPPRVFARNTSAGVNEQWVGFKVLIQRRDYSGSGTWQPFFSSARFVAMASDNQMAPFTSKYFEPSLPNDSVIPEVDYRVRLKMFWIRNGATEGTALHQVDNYKWIGGDNDGTVADFGCPGWNLEIN